MNQDYQNISKFINNKQRIIGITGGIASGKTTIAKYISNNTKIPIIDSDKIGKEELAINSDGYFKIIDHFGDNIIKNPLYSREIDRKKLASIIFSDQREKEWLESIFHPIIYFRIANEIKKYKNEGIIILLVPLLFESNFTKLCNETWLIKCSKEEQLKRLIKRDQISESEAINKINSQWPLEKKILKADIIIENNKDRDKNKWENRLKQLLLI